MPAAAPACERLAAAASGTARIGAAWRPIRPARPGAMRVCAPPAPGHRGWRATGPREAPYPPAFSGVGGRHRIATSYRPVNGIDTLSVVLEGLLAPRYSVRHGILHAWLRCSESPACCPRAARVGAETPVRRRGFGGCSGSGSGLAAVNQEQAPPAMDRGLRRHPRSVRPTGSLALQGSCLGPQPTTTIARPDAVRRV